MLDKPESRPPVKSGESPSSEFLWGADQIGAAIVLFFGWRVAGPINVGHGGSRAEFAKERAAICDPAPAHLAGAFNLAVG